MPRHSVNASLEQWQINLKQFTINWGLETVKAVRFRSFLRTYVDRMLNWWSVFFTTNQLRKKGRGELLAELLSCSDKALLLNWLFIWIAESWCLFRAIGLLFDLFWLAQFLKNLGLTQSAEGKAVVVSRPPQTLKLSTKDRSFDTYHTPGQWKQSGLQLLGI